MLSERAAAEVLALAQGLGREQARQLLLTGAAGTGVRVGRSTGYDDELVEDLAYRPAVDSTSLAEGCPHGVHVARIRRGRRFRCDWPRTEQAQALATQPAMSPKTGALVVGVPIVAWGGLPWVATVSGFVVFVATATGAHLADDGSTVFELAPPGEWSAAVAGRWFHTGPGWHWSSWHPDRLTQ